MTVDTRIPADPQETTSSFWELLNDEDRQLLARDARRHAYPAGTRILHEGEPAGSVLILLRGQVKVVAVSPRNGAQTVLAVRGPGDIVGELSAVRGWPRMASIDAVNTVEVLRISGAHFARTLAAREAVTRAVLQVVCARLREDGARRVAFGDGNLGRRVEVALFELMRHHGAVSGGGATITLPFTQQELADYIDASLVTVTRALGSLRKEGILRTGRQQIVILHPEELERRTGGEYAPSLRLGPRAVAGPVPFPSPAAPLDDDLGCVRRAHMP